MIDIHCHILFGLDDGPDSIDNSIAMSKQAVHEGIHTVIATPHHLNGQYENTAAEIYNAILAFNQVLNTHNIPLKVIAGQEVRLTSTLLSEYDCKKIVNLADGNYVLVELPSNHIPDYYEYILHELVVNGITPIIAHPERNAILLEDDDMVEELLGLGVLFQITAASVLGKFGSKIQSRALKWCMQGYVKLVASDAHNCTTRCFDLGDAYRYLESKLGKSFVAMLQSNAQAIVNGEPIDLLPVKAKKRFSIKSYFSRFKEERR